MNGCGRPTFAFRSAAVFAIAAAIAGFARSQAFASQQVNLTLMYTCNFPVIGSQSASVEVSSDIPNSITVGQSTAHYVVNASANAPWELTLGLHAYGVSTITGTVDGQAYVEAPQGGLTETVRFDIHEITLPAFSSFTGTATGSAPEVTFSKPGRAKILVGDLTLHLIPRDSNGNLTSLGEMTVPCTLNSGQNDVAASFTITGTPSPIQSISTTGSPGPEQAPTVHASPPSPSTHPLASAGTGVGPSTATSEPTQSVSLTDPGSSNGGNTAWVIGLGGLAALTGIGAVAFRYRQRRRNR